MEVSWLRSATCRRLLRPNTSRKPLPTRLSARLMARVPSRRPGNCSLTPVAIEMRIQQLFRAEPLDIVVAEVFQVVAVRAVGRRAQLIDP